MRTFVTGRCYILCHPGEKFCGSLLRRNVTAVVVRLKTLVFGKFLDKPLPAQAVQREAYLLPGIAESCGQRLLAFIHLLSLPGI